MPKLEPGGWSPPAPAPAARVASNTTPRRGKAGQRVIEDDPGASPRAAVATDASVEPTDEERRFADDGPKAKRPDPTPARAPGGPGKWSRSTHPLPNLNTSARP